VREVELLPNECLAPHLWLIFLRANKSEFRFVEEAAQVLQTHFQAAEYAPFKNREQIFYKNMTKRDV